MDDTEATSLEQIRAFLAGSGEVRFAGQRRDEAYGWVEKTRVRLQYTSLDKPGKGLVRRYLSRMTGLSRAQVTRLIGLKRRTGRVKAVVYQRTKFATRYTAADVNLLAYVDKAHGNLSGPALADTRVQRPTRRILGWEYSDYGQAAYMREASISVAHLYRLRNSSAYRKRNTSYQPTRPTPIPIGERRKPQPRGEPGFLRIDTVHQGYQQERRTSREEDVRLHASSRPRVLPTFLGPGPAYQGMKRNAGTPPVGSCLYRGKFCHLLLPELPTTLVTIPGTILRSYHSCWHMVLLAYGCRKCMGVNY